jgi:hypothetical protein
LKEMAAKLRSVNEFAVKYDNYMWSFTR